jgi:hypothetical protein
MGKRSGYVMDTDYIGADNIAATPDRSTTSHRKIVLLTLGDMDQRTLAARRAKSLIGALEETHGPDVPIEQHLRIVDLAVLNAMTEDIATRYFQGEPVDRVAFATLVNAKRRALDAL